VEETATAGGTSLIAPADVTVDAEVARMFTQVFDTRGRIDLLVNNAGTFGSPGEIDSQDWLRTIEVNLTAPSMIVAGGMPYGSRG